MKVFIFLIFVLSFISSSEKALANSVGSIAVFCASSITKNKYHTLMYDLGAEIAKRGKNLVFGGASAGLMKSTAQGFLDARKKNPSHQKLIGVIPRILAETYKVTHPELDEIFIVETKEERLVKFQELSDAFVIGPGGFGTLDEGSDVLIKGQLGLLPSSQEDLIPKPIIFFNIDGIWDDLLSQFQRMHTDNFIKAEHLHLFDVATEISDIFVKLKKETHKTGFIEASKKWWDKKA